MELKDIMSSEKTTLGDQVLLYVHTANNFLISLFQKNYLNTECWLLEAGSGMTEGVWTTQIGEDGYGSLTVTDIFILYANNGESWVWFMEGKKYIRC